MERLVYFEGLADDPTEHNLWICHFLKIFDGFWLVQYCEQYSLTRENHLGLVLQSGSKEWQRNYTTKRPGDILFTRIRI